MIENLKILVKMQYYDDQIGKNALLKESLPKQLDQLFQNLEKAEKENEEVKREIEKILVLTKNKELEQQTNLQQIEKYENQLLAIKTNKEYKALNSEIKTLNNKNSELDTEIIELMEKESELKKDLNEKNKNLLKAQNDIKEKEDVIKDKIVEVDNEIEKLKEKRNSIAAKLPKPLIRKYGALITHKNRKAVAHFNEHNGCSCCGYMVRPQSIIDVTKKEKIIYCESCGRIIIHNSLFDCSLNNQ